jgi:hypothetical protein
VDLEQLVAQQEIRDVLIRYTRGIDRMDVELVRSTYHPDAHDDHGAYQGGVEGFLAWFRDALSYFDATMHFIGNQLVELEPDEPGHDLVTALRYVDRMERRDGEWRIADRRCVFDWTRRDPIVGEWEQGPEVLQGRRDRTDPVYDH